MSNFINLTSNAVAGSAPPVRTPVASAPLPGVAGSPLRAPASVAVGRDSQVAELASLTASVNELQQAATSQGVTQSSGSTADALLTVPPLPPMPAPAQPASVATDDHGQSNIVFSNSDADGALIH